MTPLHAAFSAMQVAPNDLRVRLAYFSRLADTQLFFQLEKEAQGDRIKPKFIQQESDKVLVVRDSQNSDGASTEPVHYAAMPGRDLALMLRGHGIGLWINPGFDGDVYMMTPEEVDWFANAVEAKQFSEVETPVALHPPTASEHFLTRLSEKLAVLVGLATEAWLADAEYADGERSSVVAIVGAKPESMDRLRGAVVEAATFLTVEPLPVSVTFLEPGAAVIGRFAKVGLRFDLPQPAAPPHPAAPGSNPDRPPRLR